MWLVIVCGNRFYVFFYFSFWNMFLVLDYLINIKKGISVIFKKKVIFRINNFELIWWFDGWLNLIIFVYLFVYGSRIYVVFLVVNNVNFKIFCVIFKFFL